MSGEEDHLNQTELKFHPVTLAFPAEVEREFAAYYFRRSVRFSQAALVAGWLLYAAFGFLDRIVVLDVWKQIWIIRYGLVVPFLTLVLVLSFTKYFSRWMQPLLFAVSMIAGLSIIAMTFVAPWPANHLYYAGLLLVSIYSFVFVRLRFFLAALAQWTTFAVYMVVAILTLDIPADEELSRAAVLVNNGFFYFGANVIGMASAYFVELEMRRNFVLTEELRQEQELSEGLAESKREVLGREGEHLAQSERQVEEIQRVTSLRVETEQKLMEHLFKVSGLNAFSEKMSEARTESALLELAAEQAGRITGSQLIEVALLDASESSFNCFVLDAKDGLVATGWKSRESQTLIDHVVDEKAILLSNECREETDERWQNLAQKGMRTAMVLPMRAGTTVVGAVTAGARWGGHFDRLTYQLVQQFTAVLGTHIGLRRALGRLESSLDLSDALLVNVLPKSVASRMKQGEKQIADRIDNAAVLFCDLAGFTSYSSDASPEKVVTLLQQVFGVMEGECAVHTVEKIKTIGDSFMVAAGVTVAVEDPAHAMASFAFDAARQLRELLVGSYTTVSFRMGFHIGPVVAGVIGADRLFFDVWGDTVNMASRMESNGVQGEVTCSNEAREALADRWNFECLGPLAIKGKGEQVVWLLKGPKEGSDPATQSMDRLSSTSSEESTSA